VDLHLHRVHFLVVIVITEFQHSLPRDAMRKHGLCCGLVSVCLSVTFVLSIQMAEDIVKLLCRPGSPITLVF